MPYKNKRDQAEACRRHYYRNKKEYVARVNAFRKRALARNKKFIADYLASHPCVDCGEADIVVLDFDHVSGEKRNEVSNLARRKVSLATLQAEIDKCEVRCVKCHRRVTSQRRLQKKAAATVQLETKQQNKMLF